MSSNVELVFSNDLVPSSYKVICNISDFLYIKKFVKSDFMVRSVTETYKI